MTDPITYALAKALEDIMRYTQEWCDAIENNGTSWDDWDDHYKHFAYHGGFVQAKETLAAYDAACRKPANLPSPEPSTPSRGCICPPTSEQTCMSQLCPRKAISSVFP